MKKIIASCILALVSSQAFAHASPDARLPLKILMAKNPRAQDIESQSKFERVNTLIARDMGSVFDDKGEGYLAVNQNTCVNTANPNVVQCHLVMESFSARVDEKGRYVRTEGESQTWIDYSVDLKMKAILTVTYGMAD